MMVTFVSECEKKALIRTRRVLDAFANRIGSRTWQTVITEEGLQAVKKLLRKTATKNTAVACHWIRSRSRSELVWIVGNRDKFNSEGIVAVNTTQKVLLHQDSQNDWHVLPLIKSLTALAALFHDWGKASEYFQSKLADSKKTGDPLRHEWISTLFFNAFVNGETDEQWLTRLKDGNIEAEHLRALVCKKHEQKKDKNKPLSELPPAASFIAWLVVSHHRLPSFIDEATGQPPYRQVPAKNFKEIFKVITQKWGYANNYDEADLSRCFDYSKGLPSASAQWLKYARKNAGKLLDCLPRLEQSLEDGSWRLILHHCRLALMLGDHWYSSQDSDKQWQSAQDLYANTGRDGVSKKIVMKQKLDEHLVNVARQAVRNAHLLPVFEGRQGEMQYVYDAKPLRQKSPAAFSWQDTAVSKISNWRTKQSEKFNPDQFGFFAVNMASTGKGKTFTNAKIMRALSKDSESLRFILALGLRTLTLQTGDEYRERIKLTTDELAVLIGSRAVLEFHQKNQQQQAEDEQVLTGSESAESLLDSEIDFDVDIPEDFLQTVLTSFKSRQFLYAPVLSCTIDHLMAATETKRGGRHILPSLRLMSSDLVIDEIDDFDGADLIAVGRLIHLAGMLGRKVMISSATLPPDLVEGYYNAYQAGWAIFTKMRERSPLIGCAWIDEFTTQVQSINCTVENSGIDEFNRHHQEFIAKRLKSLQSQTVKRKAGITLCTKPESHENSEESLQHVFFSIIQNAIIEKHRQHYETDPTTGKKVSFGFVRVANINPCIELTRFLLNADWPEDIEIRAMAYHSQQVLIMRSEQEKHLDQVLKRNQGDRYGFNHLLIRQHLNKINSPNVIFVVIATPVEEVGRDHDFDWAVVEPSSFRSFIQLAGRVLRHRYLEQDIGQPNMALLQYNLKGFLGREKTVFCQPGYESQQHQLDTHDLSQLVDADALAIRLDAGPRICKHDSLNPERNLADLEHEAIHQLLTRYDSQGPESMQGWLKGCWWLTALPQLMIRFREGMPQLPVFLILYDGTWKFAKKDPQGQPIICEQVYGISHDEALSEREHQRLWLYRDYPQLLETSGKSNLEEAALAYGELGLPVHADSSGEHFVYSSQFGLLKAK
jgi:CRISPR-associated endonuclease/helicase Cas3